MTGAVCASCGQPLRPQARFCAHCGRPLATPPAAGETLRGGDYEIVRSLSKGGMGAIYLARDVRAFGRLCIIKQMLAYYDPSSDEERRRAEERFADEGRTLAFLSHPGIPKIYTFFQEGGCYYLVMEYIEGQNLESFVTRRQSGRLILPTRRLHQEEVVRYAVQLCRILEYLHSQERPVMHLDIKPANLILEAQLGDVRLVDFGTAGVRPPQPAEGGSPTVYGTDGYAPPEQYRGQPVPRSDVFAAAATCYHLLTDDDPREHPFQWPKLGSLPKELSLALQRALRPDPERRSTAAELRLALEALSTPSRTLEAFTFPGNAQIKTVGALPALCDEHWEAARHFLYDGDFVRWLRDLNRHDLAVAADEIVAAEPNRDAGLERFLHIVDPGLPRPQLAVDRPTVDLGGVAREAALIAHVSVTNRGRGYVQVTASADQPWIEIFPATISLWPGRPVDVALTIRAESLPLRHQQQGTVTLSGPDVAPVTVTVLARISVAREVLRVLWRVVSTAAPAAWHEGAEAVALCRHVTRTLTNPFERHSALLWVLWAILGVATGAGLLYHPEFAAGLPRYGPQIAAWLAEGEWPWNVFLVAAFGPAAALLALWLAFVLGAVLSCSLYGAIRGAWSALMR